MVSLAITDLLAYIQLHELFIPLAAYTMLIAVYGIFVWAFYRSLSKRDIIAAEFGKSGPLSMFVKYIVAFPVFTFAWFAALTVLLFFLSKSQTTETILLISIGVIAAVRITAYIKEDLSVDIAKILPLAVLGIYVADPAFFSLSITIDRLIEATSLTKLLANYLLFVVLLEFLLRFVFVIKRHFYPVKERSDSLQKIRHAVEG